jgi:hypothetical protein
VNTMSIRQIQDVTKQIKKSHRETALKVEPKLRDLKQNVFIKKIPDNVRHSNVIISTFRGIRTLVPRAFDCVLGRIVSHTKSRQSLGKTICDITVLQ